MHLVLKYLTLTLFGFGIIYLGYVPGQEDFIQIILPYSLCFICYYLLVFHRKVKLSFRLLLFSAILIRFILLFSFPNLSDDIYRFIWDGRCIHLGISPFEYLPSDVVGKYELLDQNLYALLNSPNYYSIYPPVGQLVNYIATFLNMDSYLPSSIIIKTFILLSELGTFYVGIKLLRLFQLSHTRILIYALNPLIIIELVGNVHHEAFMVFFTILFIYLLLKREYAWSGIAIGLAVSSKILPLMYGPLLIAHFKKMKEFWLFALAGAFVVASSFSVILNVGTIAHLKESIGLYVDKFEFNASIYYLFRWIGFQVKGYNVIHIIGPALSIAIVTIITAQAIYYFKRQKDKSRIIDFMLFAFCTYLLLATIVHPWYLSLPIALSIFTKYRFPILWSALIFLTYSNYTGGVYIERWWVIALEYIVVIAFAIYELLDKPKWYVLNKERDIDH